MLEVLGLDETHESAYRALVTVGAADVPDLARRLTLGEYDTERALRRLERHGRAAQSSARSHSNIAWCSRRWNRSRSRRSIVVAVVIAPF